MNDQKEKKWHVGVEIPDNLYQLLNLSAICLDTSKSQIMRNALQRWVEEKQIKEDRVITEIVSGFQNLWDKQKLEYSKEQIPKHFTLFIGRCRMELNQKNISQPIFDKIIKGIQK